MKKEEYQGKALVLSGDGRYYNDVAIQIIIQIAVSNGVKHIYIGQHGVLSTPAVSAMIRKLNADNGGEEAGYCFGGMILTASHNPGGPDDDWGIKFNGKNGSPALEDVTAEVYVQSKKITHYTVLDGYNPIDTSTIGDYALPQVEGSQYQHVVSIVDNSALYVEMMK